MYDKSIFVFGSKIFPEAKRDAISSLPLELSWKIFSYLDDIALRKSARICKIWHRIILSHSNLRKRLNNFELAIKLGSESLARFYKQNKGRRRKRNVKKYLPVGQITERSIQSSILKSKRGGDDIVVYTKRYKLL